ncbi:putative copia-type protein, partial [Tanacetum coccineum]
MLHQDSYYQTSKSHKSYAPTSKASLPTRSHATTRYKGKEIAKPITPPSESASEEDSDPEQAQKDKDINKNMDTTPRYKNDNQTGQFGNQRAVNVVGARETIGGLEVNELRAERMTKNANPLALVATAQTLQDTYYQSSKPHKSYAPTSKASLPSRSHATIRHKGKEIAKPITPPSESASEEDSDLEQAQKDKDMQKNLALIAKYFKKLYKPTNNSFKTSSNTRNKNVDTTPRYKNDNQTGHFGNQRAVNIVGARETESGIQCFNYKEFGHFSKECRKPKWVKDSTYHKEKMLLCKQAEKGVQLQA